MTVLTLCILTFVPIRFVHPLRVRRFRVLTVTLLALWAVLASVAVQQGLKPWPYDKDGRFIRPEDRERYTPWGIEK